MDLFLLFQGISWLYSDWCFPKINEDTKEGLQYDTHQTKLNLSIDIEEVISKSREFPIPFPIETVRLQQLQKRKPLKKLKKNIESTYPIAHERVLSLMAQFLNYKRKFGSTPEKRLYKHMSVIDFVDRILKKRAISFYDEQDAYKLISGEQGVGGWEAVGTETEKPPLLLENCLSYDEMKLSAMVYVSGHTECINDGDRYNVGIVNEQNIEDHAVIIGLIGTRFEREAVMDFEDILITKDQNRPENGYGVHTSSNTCQNISTSYPSNNELAKSMWRKLWSEFYEVPSYIYDELAPTIVDDDKEEYQRRFVKIQNKDYIFDNEVFYKRLTIIGETLLLEADQRAEDEKKFAFVNVVGVGLGVWKISRHQVDVFILTFIERIQSFLRNHLLDHISDVNFAYVRPSTDILDLFTNSVQDNKKETKMFIKSDTHPKGGINVQIENRNPSAKLPPEHAGKLLILTYAWDGNAHPGNDFWVGSLSSTGDPAAASSTQVAELHNAYVNRAVSGDNLRVVTRQGLKSASDYVSHLNITT